MHSSDNSFLPSESVEAGEEPIAIIGLACRFPGASDYREFWSNLEAGIDAVVQVPEGRWDCNRYYSHDRDVPGKTHSKWGGYLDRIDLFDHRHFHISPREARGMDPQQRLLLEQAWRCVEDAGLGFEALRAERTGVFVGSMTMDHGHDLLESGLPIDGHAGSGTYAALLANRISHQFGFEGPSCTVDAACASSLVALHQARRALLAGDCEYALVGAVNVNTHPWKYIAFSKARMLSPTGRCRTFDRDADGYVPGEGVAVVLLRPLGRALAEGCSIHGVIRGSAVNHSGRTVSLTAPRVSAQREVLLAAYRAAGLSPATVGYLEAHGTGTSLGDPIEVEALTQAFRHFTEARGFCRIGSVKSNIGHLEAAAGLAGLVKVLGMMQRQRIFQSLHIRVPNPLIDFDASPFVLARASDRWPGTERRPRRAGVSAFGFGGANAHVVIEEPPGAAADSIPLEPVRDQLFVLSARSPLSLRRILEAWAAFAEHEDFAAYSLDDVCRTLQIGREQLPCRFGARVATRAELANALRRNLEAPDPLGPDQVPSEDSAWGLRLGRPGAGVSLDLPEYWKGATVHKDFADRLPTTRPQDWPDDLRAFAVLYGMGQKLLAVLPRPAWISGEGPGQWAAVALSGLLPIEACVAGLLGEPQRALPQRPEFAYADSALADVVLPMGFHAASLCTAADQLRVDEDLFAALLDQAEALAQGQWTFRRFLAEWTPALAGTGRDAQSWLNAARGALPATERERLAIVLLTALRKLRRKWQLSEQLPKLCPVLDAWAELAAVGFLTPEEALLLPERDPVSLEQLADALRTRLGRSPEALPPNLPALPCAKEVPEISDPAAWFRGVGRNPAGGVLVAGLSVLDVGEVAGVSAMDVPSIQIALSGSPAREREDAVLALWLAGVRVDWDELSGHASFKRLPLPVYAFDCQSFRLPPPVEAPATSFTETPTVRQIPPDIHYLAPAWVSRPPEPAVLPPPTRALVFALDQGPLGPAVAASLTAQGVTVHLVRCGHDYAGNDGDGTQGFVVSSEEDYEALLAEVLEPARRIESLHIYWLAVAPPPGADEDAVAVMARIEQDALREPWLLLRALLRQPVLPRCRLLTVTRDALAVLPGDLSAGFAGAAWLGLGTSAALENGHFASVLLDLDANSLASPEIAGRLSAELRSKQVRSPLAYRKGRRYVRHFEPTRLNATAAIPARDGLLVVSGGGGAIGLQIVEWLVKCGHGAIALLGRSPLSSKASRCLETWRETGADVEYLQVDVAEREALLGALAALRRRHGAIAGVIHAAGVVEDRLLASKSCEAAARVFATKVRGALGLHEATLGDPLAFFILFSSVVGSTGNAGQADYAAANAVLDSFAAYRAAGGFAGQTLSIGWPLWADGGMGRDNVIARNFAARGLGILEPGAGLAAFAGLFGTAQGAVLVHTSARFEPDAGRAEAPATSASFVPPEATVEPSDPGRRDRVRHFVLDALARRLDIEPEAIRSEESFFSLGLESILLQELQEELGRVFPDLPPTLLFEYPNVDALAGYLERRPSRDLPAANLSESAAVLETAVPRVQEWDAPATHSEGTTGYGIAVIGVAGRFPEASDVAAYWENLLAGRDCIREIPPDRWDLRRYFDPAMANEINSYGKWGGFIADVDRFDALFFNVSPREAEQMDPQQRLLLETTYATLEDAGYAAVRRRQGHRIGLFVGSMWNEYSLFSHEYGFLTGRYQGPGSQSWAIANRVSYFMDFRGPSIALDTACSSSLTAVHLACQSLLAGDCDLAAAGGVNLNLHPSKLVYLSQARFLSSDGRCRSFGAGGDGYVPGEGVGMVLLKPLDRALADGDRVYGVIRSSASNHGGRATGFTVPNPEAHAELILAALARGGVDARDIGYVECHGTGTALGDPIEIRGLANAFAQHGVGRGSCTIGSAKSGIGHLEAAAGVAGLVKVLLSLRHGLIPPSLHSAELNPRIDFAATPFILARETTPWVAPSGGPRLAGLSSFGAGGSNAHLVVEEFPEPVPMRAAHSAAGPNVVCLSARNEERLRVAAGQLAGWLGREPSADPADLAYSLNLGREGFDARLAVVAVDSDDLRRQLRDYSEGRGATWAGHARDRSNPHRGISLPADPEGYAVMRPEVMARAFVAGLEPDFATYHRYKPGRWLSLPHYPFKRDRYWIEPASLRSTAEAVSTAAHPWLETASTARAAKSWRVNLAAAHDWVADHVVGGRSILPGAAVLDLALAAAREGPDPAAAGLAGVVFERPVPGDGSSARLEWTAEPDGEWQFRLLVPDTADAPRCASGRIAHEGFEHMPSLDIAGWKDSPALNPEEAYARFERLGFRYGPVFRPISELRRRGDEALARLELPAAQGPSFTNSPLHPVLLDGALQASLVLLDDQVAGALPYAIGGVVGLRPLESPLYAWVRPARQWQPGAEIARMHIDLYDKTGRGIACLRDFSLRLLRSEARPVSVPAGIGLYRPAWHSAPVAGHEKSISLAGAELLVFDTETELFNTLRKRLSETGLILVRPKERFAELGESAYGLRPGAADDYCRLLDELAEVGRRPTHFLLLWPYRGTPVDLAGDPVHWETALEQRLAHGPGALLAWCKALLARRLIPLRGLVLDHGSRSAPVPEAEALAGFVRSQRMEQPRLDTGVLFLAGPDPGHDALADVLLDELRQPAVAPEIWRDASGRYRAGAEALAPSLLENAL